MKKLNDLVHSTAEIFFVPGSKNSIALNTYAFDTLKINNEVVNAKELYMWLKKHYELASNDSIVHAPYIPVQTIDKKNVSKFEKDIIESAKHECHTKYGDLKKHAVFGNREAIKEMLTKKKAEDKPNYTVLTFDQYKEFGRQRIDESKDSEWQCPTCKHRVKNLQRQYTKDGNLCWGCQKFCDTLDASYFHGKACKMYDEGYSGYIWL